MPRAPFYYLLCNHWTQGGIGFAFPSGWYGGRRYDRTFSTVYTIHKMLDAADDFPDLKVSMELDAYAYEEVQKEDPACIERLKRYISEGKAGVDGGTYGQPFGQDYGWEPNIRQLTYGRRTVADTLGYEVRAFLVEEQWFHPQLPQLLLKSGFTGASLQNQNSGQVSPMNEAMFRWVGLDGSKIPAIPANDLQVSCVRQYTDYSAYESRLNTYDHPLLFQWVEIWPPGMDWGASAAPFAKAVEQVKHWGGQPVTLGEYFELEAAERVLTDRYIPLDESNYANNWYQGGGWGYDGDRVILSDKKAEQALIAFETLAALSCLRRGTPYPERDLERLWKKLLILQNHDFSVARSYRAVSDDGMVTQAGSLAIVEYERMTRECSEMTNAWLRGSGSGATEAGDPAPVITVFNPLAVAHTRVVELELPGGQGGSPVLYQGDRRIPFQEIGKTEDRIRGLALVELPSMGAAELLIGEGAQHTIAESGVIAGNTWLEDANIRVEWVPHTWHIYITDKATGNRVRYTGFTGPIGKMNEHDAGKYHALSPGHEQFTFAFDGPTHAPDQVARVEASLEATGEVRSTLRLRCDLLTLHTTSTPVAFAEVSVSVDHATGKIECRSYLYTGVYLSMQCWSEFAHELPEADYYRDFPFGEEKTKIDDIYPNTYIRTVSPTGGFMLVHPGVQKVKLTRKTDGGTIKHLLARDQVSGEYTWSFVLRFGKFEPWEACAVSQAEKAAVTVIRTDTEQQAVSGPFLALSEPNVLVSAMYRESGRIVIRLVNFSDKFVPDAALDVAYPFANAVFTDFNGHISGPCKFIAGTTGTRVTLAIQPWEIITLSLQP